jgi:hypothetical protein
MEKLATGGHGVLTGWVENRVHFTELSEVVSQPKPLDLSLLDMAGMLSK